MKDLVLGIDAGTSVIKTIAFSLDGQQLGAASKPNRYDSGDAAAVDQDMQITWESAAETIRELATLLPDLASRVAAVAVTGQGDGTWLIDANGEPVMPAWLWLDGRAGEYVEQFSQQPGDVRRFELTGSGLAACQQGPQMMWMRDHAPHWLEAATSAMHCKDWLYFKLTGERVTDPSEGCFTFGNFRNRQYADDILSFLELSKYRSLLPPMLDGTEHWHPLSQLASDASGLKAGTPVVLGYVDVVCTALGAGLYDARQSAGCTIIGSTGMHMQLARSADAVILNQERTGYVMTMPIPGCYAQMQSNMASTINIDWLLDVAVDLLADMGMTVTRPELVGRIEGWMAQSSAGDILYQPYISEAGERGPIIERAARAGFCGLSMKHRFPDLVRAVIEGLALAARDCYSAMGELPDEVRLAGGAARSASLRQVFAAMLGTSVRTSQREEAGAAGAAMIASVCLGHYDNMDDCVRQWVEPLLSPVETHDSGLAEVYESVFPLYVETRRSLRPIWRKHAQNRTRFPPVEHAHNLSSHQNQSDEQSQTRAGGREASHE